MLPQKHVIINVEEESVLKMEFNLDTICLSAIRILIELLIEDFKKYMSTPESEVI
jgi:hypothetical protein